MRAYIPTGNICDAVRELLTQLENIEAGVDPIQSHDRALDAFEKVVELGNTVFIKTPQVVSGGLWTSEIHRNRVVINLADRLADRLNRKEPR